MLRVARWSLVAGRRYHEHRVTDHIQFITNDTVTVDPKTLRITRPVERPICVQLYWMSAAPAQTRRFSRLVLGELDVLAVRCELRHVLRPETGAQRIALELLRWMTANDSTYVLYGLSIGAYLWSEAMVRAARDPQYRPALDRVAVQIWDSIGNLKHTPTGIPLALFPSLAKNKLASQWAGYICDSWYRFYLRTNYSSVTGHYERAAHALRHTTCRAPALLLHARRDAIAPCEYARGIHDAWLESGVQSTWKCWEKSDHVASYLYHPQEYRELVLAHIRQHLPRREQPA